MITLNLRTANYDTFEVSFDKEEGTLFFYCDSETGGALLDQKATMEVFEFIVKHCHELLPSRG